MSDYIKREDAIGIVKNLKRFSCFGDDGFVEIPMVYFELMKVATADVAPVRHGHWIKISPAGIYECSECQKDVMTSDIEAYEHCHGCGARMDEVEEDD